jgi:hypothetical protein
VRAASSAAAAGAGVAWTGGSVHPLAEEERQQVVDEPVRARARSTVDQQGALQPPAFRCATDDRPRGGLPDAQESCLDTVCHLPPEYWFGRR